MVAFSGTGCVAWITPDSVVPVDAGLCSAVAVSGSVTPVLLVPVPSVDAVVSFGSMTMNIPPPVSWSLSCVAAETCPPTVPRCAIILPSITQETTSRPASTATSAINAARLPLPEPDGAAAGGAYTYPCPPVGVVSAAAVRRCAAVECKVPLGSGVNLGLFRLGRVLHCIVMLNVPLIHKSYALPFIGNGRMRHDLPPPGGCLRKGRIRIPPSLTTPLLYRSNVKIV